MTLNNLQDATVILVIVVVTVVCVCLFLDIYIFFVSFASYECHNIAILSCQSIYNAVKMRWFSFVFTRWSYMSDEYDRKNGEN